jgi:hypothetical protein
MMEVDMSPEAVTARLRTMDELWLLSVKLMNSKHVTKSRVDLKKQCAIEIQDSIRQILFKEWDPIGVNDNPSHVDEYDSYIAPIYRLLSTNRSEEAIMDFLFRTEQDVIGVSCGSPEDLRPLAQKLLGLDVYLDNKPGR